MLWLPTVIQQVSTSPGNLTQAYRFLTTHHAVRTLTASMKAADTLFGLFPFRFEELPAKRDANPAWLVAHPVWDHPWYLAYIGGTVLVGIAALIAKRLPALALAASSSIAILAAGWSILLVYGPLFPYLVIWTGALVIPAWIATWLVVTPPLPSIAAAATPGAPDAGTPPTRWLTVPAFSVVVAAGVCVAFAASQPPLTDGSTRLARASWHAVARAALAPRVKTVYVDIMNQDAMPQAAAIADQLVRRHRRVEINRAALYYVDPSFAAHSSSQLKVVVCCGRGDPGRPPMGVTYRGDIRGQRIYMSGGAAAKRRVLRPFPRPGYLREPGYFLGNMNDRRAHAL